MIFSEETTLTVMLQFSVSFCEGKYSILDSFSFPEFTAYYSLIYKPKETNESEEYQPDLLPNSLMEVNHELS